MLAVTFLALLLAAAALGATTPASKPSPATSSGARAGSEPKTSENCPRHLGEMSLSYEESNDNDRWFGRYGFINTKYYGYNAKVHTRRVYWQQQQVAYPFQQQQQVNNYDIGNAPNIPSIFSKPLGVPAPAGAGAAENATEGEEKEEPLPIWRLSLSRSVESATVALIEDGRSQETFAIDTEVLASNLTTITGSYRMSVDVTQWGVKANSWYLICAYHNFVTKGKKSPCRQCTLKKAGKQGAFLQDEVLDLELDTREQSSTSAVLAFNVADLPLPSAAIQTLVFAENDDFRCRDGGAPPATFKQRDVIYPNSVLLVDVAGLIPHRRYSIQTNLEMTVDGKNITILDYLPDARRSKFIGRCERFT